MSATATTDPPPWPVRVLGPADLAPARALSAAAEWNQVEADWRVFLELGHLLGIDAPGHGLVATAATLPLGHEFGWISMMVVRPDFRRRGLGRQLLGHCILDLAAQGLVPGLDATPAGRELYQQHEFRDTWAMTRWKCDRPATAAPGEAVQGLEVRAATAADLDAIAALDHRAFGTRRRSVLARLLERAPWLAALALRAGEPCGFLLARDGREAFQLGPLAAVDADAAIALLGRTFVLLAGGAYIDVLDRHHEVAAWLAAHGFAPQRRLTRMLYRHDEPFGDGRVAVAIAGPELG
jgi:ribosomal protein S18 acetylase RimI-like enzyme